MKAYCQKYRLKKNKQKPIEKTITRCRSLIPNALEGDLRRSHQFEKFGIYGKRLENHFVKYTNALQNSSVLDIGRFAWYTNLLLTEVVTEKQKMYGIKFFGGNYFPNYSVIYLNFISLFISSVCFFFFLDVGVNSVSTRQTEASRHVWRRFSARSYGYSRCSGRCRGRGFGNWGNLRKIRASYTPSCV